MDLKILGCATPFPRRDNPCSGYLLSEGESKVLLDCGSGVFGALIEYVNPNELSGVWISHLHPDHFADLPALANWALNTPGASKLPVFGPEGWDRRLNFFLSGDQDRGPSGEIFEVGYISDGASIEVGSFRLDNRAVRHSVVGYGVRITTGHTSFAYSGDTGPCDALPDLALRADLLLCEAGSASPAEYHLTAQQACEVAIAAGVGEILLTHIPGSPENIEIDAPDGLAVGFARPGDVWLIGSE